MLSFDILPHALVALYLRWPRLRHDDRRGYFPVPLARRCFREALVLGVDPARIARMITKVRREPRGSAVPNRQRRTRPTRKPFRRHFIWSGNWDQEARPFTEHPLYIDFLEVFEAKFEYRTTRAYAKRVEAIHRGRPYSQVPLGKASAEPLDTLAKIDFYFEERIKLIHSMMQEGYRSQQELGGVQSEIGVAVGRNGELLKWTNGRNRLVAAKIARVPKVFVGVDFVHRLWVERCMERYPMSPLVAIRSGLRDLERG